MTDNIPENTQEVSNSQEKVEISGIKDEKLNNNTAIQSETDESSESDPNWKAFREARKKDKAEREAAERRAQEKEAEVSALKAAMEAAFSKNNPTPQQQYSYDNEESEDDIIEKKVQAAIAKREAASAKERMEREKNELPQRLVSAFPDYHQVINEENGAYLEYHHPELYRSILRQPENFETCSDIYRIVKKYVPNSTTAKKESARADANFSKPKSISSTGLTQNTEVSSGQRLTEERKAQNWERMQRLLKGVG